MEGEERFSGPRVEESFEEVIKGKMQEAQTAIAVAPTREELERRVEEINVLGEQFSTHKISPEDYSAKIKKLTFNSHSVIFNTIMEMHECLRRLQVLQEGYLEETIAHENDHLNRAQMHGLKGAYSVEFAKDIRDGKTIVSVLPSALVRFPKEMPTEERMRIRKEILQAPDELSPSDKRQLDSARR